MFLQPRGSSLRLVSPCEFLEFLIVYVDLLVARWDAQD